MQNGELKEVLNAIKDNQGQYIKALDNQATVTKQVLNEVSEVKESVKRLHDRLDETARETSINTERISNIKEQCDKCKTENERQFNIVHESIRRRDGTLKWLAASIVMPIVLALVAIFKPQ